MQTSFWDDPDFQIIEEVDYKIIEERNVEIKKLADDIEGISEIMTDLALLVGEQGENIEIAEKNIEESKINVEEAVTALGKTEVIVNRTRNVLRSVGIVAGGLSLGALGFLGGPIIGAIGIITGGALGGGVAFATNKIF